MQHLQYCLKYTPDDRYTASCLLFAMKNIISRGYEGLLTFLGISRRWRGSLLRLAKMENPKGWGVLYEIPSLVGVWIFSETTHFSNNLEKSEHLKHEKFTLYGTYVCIYCPNYPLSVFFCSLLQLSITFDTNLQVTAHM